MSKAIFKYKINDILNNDFIIKDVKKENRNNGYILECLKCGYTFFRIKNNVENNTRECPVCSNKTFVKGYNDIYTKNPEYIKYFKNIDDSKNVSIGSHKRVDLVCPTCGAIKNTEVRELKSGFKCKNCINKGSYCEILIFSILKKLNIDFEREKIFDWSQNKRYDFYIPSLSCIIEANGLQHYEDTSWSNYLFQQNNDKLKERLAKENGIKNYIILDCRKSNLDFIKKSVLNSELSKLFDLSNIDWEQCIYENNEDMILKISNIYNEQKIGSLKIGKQVNLPKTTVQEYLKIADKKGFCKYNKEEIEKIRKENAKKETSKSKSVKVICLNDLKIFNSISQCADYYNVNRISVLRCCNHQQDFVYDKNGKCYEFIKLEEYNKKGK